MLFVSLRTLSCRLRPGRTHGLYCQRFHPVAVFWFPALAFAFEPVYFFSDHDYFRRNLLRQLGQCGSEYARDHDFYQRACCDSELHH
jgi:hypothetical protein